MQYKNLLFALTVSAFGYADQGADHIVSKIEDVPATLIQEREPARGYTERPSNKQTRGWDCFLTADYIYWGWQQDSMEIATLTPDDPLMDNVGANTYYQNPGYASGFQVGLGACIPVIDHWNLYAEYTWYKNSSSAFLESTNRSILQLGSSVASLPIALDGTFSQKISLDFNNLDALLKRPFYLGKKWQANVGIGLKTLWITQRTDSAMQGFIGVSTQDLSVYTTSDVMDQKQTSWSLGPNFALETNWLLGFGFQIVGTFSMGVLYANYTLSATHTAQNDDGLREVEINTFIQGLDDYGTLRATTETFLGLRWGRGFSEKWHLDLSAGYDFNVYWNYNMNDYPLNKVAGNLYLQGLNLQARFDF